jgi:hypothetical protein
MTKMTKPLPHTGGSFIRDKNGALKKQSSAPQTTVTPEPAPAQDKALGKSGKMTAKEA